MDSVMLVLNLNYDSKYDILYVRTSEYTPSYGDETDGVVTFRSIDTDAVTGMAIYNVKTRVQNGDINESMLPIPINLSSLAVQTLLYRPEKGYKCTLQLA